MSDFAQRYTISAARFDLYVQAYRNTDGSPASVYATGRDLFNSPHATLAGMLAVAVRREVRRRNGVRTLRRRAARRTAVLLDRALDAEAARDDALDERDGLRAALRDVKP